MALIAYMFLNIEGMAIEIEQPFGDDPNDLPIEARQVHKSEVYEFVVAS